MFKMLYAYHHFSFTNLRPGRRQPLENCSADRRQMRRHNCIQKIKTCSTEEAF